MPDKTAHSLTPDSGGHQSSCVFPFRLSSTVNLATNLGALVIKQHPLPHTSDYRYVVAVVGASVYQT